MVLSRTSNSLIESNCGSDSPPNRQGVAIAESIGGGDFLVLSPTEEGLTVAFQRVAEAKSGKNRLHLDLVVENLDAVTAEVESLGGRWLEPGLTRELEGFRWRIRADPEGNEFDLDTLPD